MQLSATFARLFPPPYYLRLPSVGVDISDTSLKYIAFAPTHNGSGFLSIETFGDIPLEEGVITRGVINDPKKLATALVEVRKRTGIQYVRVSLPEERAYLFETRVKKGTPFKQIRGALEFRLEENVPLSPKDAYFDYDIYELKGVSGELGVSVTAYACDTIDSYYQICKEANVIPLSFEVEASAIARAVLDETQGGTHFVVDFGKTRTGVGIVQNGVLMYTSTIDVGGNQLSAALKKHVGEKDEGELTKIKNEQGLVAGGTEKGVHEALLGTVSVLKDELAKRIEYWNGRDVGNEDRFIDQIIICGGTANLNGLPEYLTKSLNIETVRANVWKRVLDVREEVPPIDRNHSYGYATAIGLALTNL